MTSIGPPDNDGRSVIVLQVDAGYPVATLLLSPDTLLAIAYDPVTGLLASNTSDIYLPAPTRLHHGHIWMSPACMLAKHVKSLPGTAPAALEPCASCRPTPAAVQCCALPSLPAQQQQ